MTTKQPTNQCPLCGRDYPREAMVHHLAFAHYVNLDRTRAMGPRTARALLKMEHHNPYHAKRAQHES